MAAAGYVSVGVSIPKKLLDRIDRERGRKVPIKPRSEFICEVVEKHLKKEE